MNEPNNATAAITAEPIATPLVIALVVLPTSSSWLITLRAFSSMPAISPMPLALSEIGPKESIATLLPVSVSMPMPVMATPYKTYATCSAGVLPMPEKITVEEKMVAAITITDHTALSYPCTKPEMMVVAGPPVRDLTIFLPAHCACR